MAKILDGKIVRDKIAEELRSTISDLSSPPKLVIIQVGDNPESNTYIRQKVLFGEKIGAIVKIEKLPNIISEAELVGHINQYNNDNNVHGIIVQMPIPDKFDKNEVIESINSKKDVDGQTATNIKLLFEGSTPVIASSSEARAKQSDSEIASSSSTPRNDKNSAGFIPATTKGIFTLLDFYKIPVAAKHVVVVGRSTLVGKPTALLALNKNATVTICHSKTKNLAEVTKSADILIVAAGKPKLITKNHVSKNQVVIDVGINVLENPSVIAIKAKQSDYEIASSSSTPRNDKLAKPETEPTDRKLVGDVDFESVSKIVRAISPVPSGIGPMTVASLFQNLLEAYKRQLDLS